MSYFTDTEIDEIIGAVEESMQNAANLAKSADFKDEEMGDGPEMGEAEMGGEEALAQTTSEEAPQEPISEEAPQEAMSEEAPQEPISEEAPQEAMGEEQLGEESLEEDDGELSDEELHQIYSSMEPSDLERHYMIIRGMLRDSYAKMEKSESSDKGEESLSKKEDYEAKIKELTKNQKEMESSLAAAFKAMELMAKPERKAVTSEIQVLGKTESDVASSNAKEEVDFSTLSKNEIVSKINEKVKDPKLAKSERDIINQYLLHGEGKEQVFNLLRSN